MSFAAYAFILVFLSSLLELLLDSFGIGIPFLAMACFYLSVACGVAKSIPCALLGGCALDSILGRETPWTALLLLLAVGLGQLWLRRVEARTPLLLPLPGALLPLLLLLPWTLPSWEFSAAWLTAFFDCVSGTLLAMFCSSLLLPFAVLSFDYFGEKFDLELFADAKDRLAREK
jgi:hypothetical protein